MTERDPGLITGYHAHIYYNGTTRETAARIRAALNERFDVELGRWRDEPVGPHPQSMYQVAFPTRNSNESCRGSPSTAGVSRCSSTP